MTAMDAADRNAEKLLDELSLQYNRVRQSAITRRLPRFRRVRRHSAGGMGRKDEPFEYRNDCTDCRPGHPCGLPEGKLPRMKEALTVEVGGKTRVMEVAQHVGRNVVCCVMLAGSEGLARGAQVTALGHPIEVPVGEVTLGRMFNVLANRSTAKVRFPPMPPVIPSTVSPPPLRNRARRSRSSRRGSR